VAGVSSKWAGRRKIKPDELLGEPWTFPPAGSIPGRNIANAFQSAGLSCPRPTVPTDSISAIIHLLAAGRYVRSRGVKPTCQDSPTDAVDPTRTSATDFAAMQTPAGLSYLSDANGVLMTRALSMKSLARGLRVRFFIVTITTGNCRAGNSTGNTLSGRFLALKRIIESGSTVRKRLRGSEPTLRANTDKEIAPSLPTVVRIASP
jgi:hypothetical protein